MSTRIITVMIIIIIILALFRLKTKMIQMKHGAEYSHDNDIRNCAEPCCEPPGKSCKRCPKGSCVKYAIF